MLEILDSPKHLIAIRLSGQLTASDIETAYKAADEKLKESERVSFFVEVEPSMRFTVEGLIKDVVQGAGELGRLHRYHRAAIVTDKGWMATFARLEGLVFCSMDVRVFDHSDRDKAFAWASVQPEPVPDPVEPEPSIHFLQTTSEGVFAYEINGRLRERDIKSAVEELKPYFKREGKFNVLARMKDFNGFDLFAVFDDDLIRLKIKTPSKVAKYAVIGAGSWMRNLIELVYPLVGIEVRTFDLNEEPAAWEWVGAQQALLPE